MQTLGLILAGGASERMGRDKASLPFGERGTLFSSVVDRLMTALGSRPIMVVAAAGQVLPPVEELTCVVNDRAPNRGPLEALATGLNETPAIADGVFAVGCDTPLLEPALVRLVVSRLEGCEAAVPVLHGRRQPLLTAYRVSAAAVAADRLLASGESSLQSLLDALDTVEIPETDLRETDPGLRSLMDCNDPESYKRVLKHAGFA